RDQRPPANPRRRLPAADRRLARRGRLNRKGEAMSTAEIVIPAPQARPRAFSPLVTLARRRFQLTARTPRELFVPLLTPIMFALVIAPALKTALHTDSSYESFVAIGTVGL